MKKLVLLIFILLTAVSNLWAFTVTFSPMTYRVGLGSDQKNNAFELVVNIENADGLSSTSSGFKDVAVYFDTYDITSWFVANLQITSMDNTHLTAKVDIPSGILQTGIYFLSLGIRNQKDEIASGNALIIIGNPNIVSPGAGDASTLRSLVENSANKYIYIPSGHYYLTDDTILRLKDGQTIWGDGPDSTILDGSGIKTSGLSPLLVIGKNIKIGFVSVGNTSTGSGISLDGTVSALVNNITSSQNKGGGVVAYNGASLTVVSSLLENNSYDGATMGQSSTGSIVMTKTTGNGFDGFGAEKSGALNVDFCETHGNSGVGIGYFSKSTGSIRRAFVYQNQQAGIFIGEGSSVQSVSSNRVTSCGTDGIGVNGQNSTANDVSGNMINGNVSGVTVNNSGKISGLNNNQFSYNTNTNMSVVTGGVVSGGGNTFAGANIGIGIDGSGSQITLSSDKVGDSQSYGILFQNNAVGSLTALNISGNKNNGVSVGSSAQLNGDSLTISGNQGFGIGIDNSGSAASLSSCQIFSNNNYGIIVFESHGAKYIDQGGNQIYSNSPANIGRW